MRKAFKLNRGAFRINNHMAEQGEAAAAQAGNDDVNIAEIA